MSIPKKTRKWGPLTADIPRIRIDAPMRRTIDELVESTGQDISEVIRHLLANGIDVERGKYRPN